MREKKRPLVLSRAPSASLAPAVPLTAPATPPALPVIMGAHTKLAEVIADIGTDGVLNILAAMEKAATEKVAA